ncbi:MAG: hypothetical protein PHG85_03705 [Candidatus Altiarchaeota archaeon]|nr:hypothetical protein [Candidatus Altiarchaeota archaeon]
MKKYLITAGLMLFLLLIPNASASSGCSLAAYQEACTACNFTIAGEIDQNCKDANTESGKACLMAAYPVMAFQYQDGNCPEVDECKATFDTCSVPGCLGTDKQDCTDPICKLCYTQGDTCLEQAAMECTDKFYDENPWMELCPCLAYLPLLASAMAVILKVMV